MASSRRSRSSRAPRSAAPSLRPVRRPAGHRDRSRTARHRQLDWKVYCGSLRTRAMSEGRAHGQADLLRPRLTIVEVGRSRPPNYGCVARERVVVPQSAESLGTQGAHDHFCASLDGRSAWLSPQCRSADVPDVLIRQPSAVDRRKSSVRAGSKAPSGLIVALRLPEKCCWLYGTRTISAA